MAKDKSTTKASEIQIESLKVGRITVWIRGTTPLICNRMAGKAMRDLLNPKGKKTLAEKQQTLKHDPVNEYRNSMSVRSGDGPTRLLLPSPAIKGAIASAALETPGTTRAQIGRLVWVDGMYCDLYGVPKLHMGIVRSADINKTPDVRTRAIIDEWCVPATIQYVRPQMSDNTMLQLLANGGLIIGVGDFRQEKGKGNFGQYQIVSEAECAEIIANGGMVQQDEAIRNPVCFDSDTAELLAWFHAEVEKRGKSALLSGGAVEINAQSEPKERVHA